MNDDTLRALAKAAGVATHWTDQGGADHQVSPETLRAILYAIGLPSGDDAELRNSMSMVEAGLHSSFSSRFTTARVGQPVVLPSHMRSIKSIEIELEGGADRTVTAMDNGDGTFTLPAFTEPGYHRVLAPDGAFTVATAPERCLTVADLSGKKSTWGISTQIYSLRSAGDGGIGNFAGVAALGRAAGKLGADALAISPVHALFGADPSHYSPYSPSTRLFYNPLHAEPTLVIPEDVVREAIARCGIADEMSRLEQLRDVDWIAATPTRWKLLRELYHIVRHQGGDESQWRMNYDNFIREASSLLKSHATFEALHASILARNPGAWHWRDWPVEFRDPDSPEVAEFAQQNEGEIHFQMFLQWLTGRSYAEAQRACRDSGMAMGLIADLAIGMEGSGSHAWSRQQDVLSGVSVGAPPDYYAINGQDWGLTTFSPRGLVATGFAPFIETLRAALRYVGGIRIDHVMGLSRLWLIPRGAKATEGAYVHFPSETMFRLIALESWRHKAVVIGEDLGTLPDGFQDYLRGQGIAGMRVLRFERDANGFTRPEHWDQEAAAMTTTHDLVPTAGWWSGADIERGPEADEKQSVRAWDRGLLWSSFQRAGVAEGERPEPENADVVVDAAVRLIAKTPCQMKLLSMEDVLGVRTQPNVPGTTTEKPNWRHRLDGDAADLLEGKTSRYRLEFLGQPRD
jgi:4-alpha-glucanotransferase